MGGDFVYYPCIIFSTHYNKAKPRILYIGE